jgi:hypothetical protein
VARHVTVVVIETHLYKECSSVARHVTVVVIETVIFTVSVTLRQAT